MFVDLVGSTPLSGRLDPEDLRKVVHGYHSLCVTTISAHDGFVANYQGDGILAYFGFPVAHEEDAVQAVRAGLRIIEALPALAAELKIDDLAARVGVHTGLVVVGEVVSGPSNMPADVVGEALNIASRVQSLAEPGQVVITGSTRALVDGFVTVEPLGTQSLRGVDKPMSLFVVRGETSARSRLEAAGGRTKTLFVGRDTEMGVLLRCWDATRTGSGQVVVISGEPGIGKSRLVLELREHVKADGGAVVGMRGSPRLRNSAMQPIIDHLRRALGLETSTTTVVDDALGRIEQLIARSSNPPPGAVDVIAELLEVDTGAEHPQVPLGPEARRRQTLDVLMGLLLGLADERPTLLVCDDVQWFDPTTVDLMAELLAGRRLNGLLVVITHRSDHSLPWPAIDGAVALALGGLRPEEVDRVVAELCDGRELPADLQRQIADRTDGVPLFVEETTQMLLDVAQDAVGVNVALNRAVPSTLRDLLMARLDRQGSAIEVAQLAAAFGREVPGEFLRAIWPGDQARLERGLEHLVASGLLQRQRGVESVTYVFKHALVQDVAYDSLLRSTRVAHHRVIAEALAERPDAKQNPELVAHHFASAAMPERALHFWLLAGDRALERSADREAVAHLTAGLELMPELPPGKPRDEQELTLLVRLGAPLMATRWLRIGRGRRGLSTSPRPRRLARRRDPAVRGAVWDLPHAPPARRVRHRPRRCRAARRPRGADGSSAAHRGRLPGSGLRAGVPRRRRRGGAAGTRARDRRRRRAARQRPARPGAQRRRRCRDHQPVIRGLGAVAAGPHLRGQRDERQRRRHGEIGRPPIHAGAGPVVRRLVASVSR